MKKQEGVSAAAWFYGQSFTSASRAPAPPRDLDEYLRNELATAERRLAQLDTDHAARRKTMQARRESMCPQHQQPTVSPNCKKRIAVGDTIVQPYEKNREGGNRFGACWYCENCGNEAHAHGNPVADTLRKQVETLREKVRGAT